MYNYSKKLTAQLLLYSLLLESCYNPNIGTGKKTLPAPAAPTYQQRQYEERAHNKPTSTRLTPADHHPIQPTDHPRQPQAAVRSQAPATTQPLPRPGSASPRQQRVQHNYKHDRQLPSARIPSLRNQNELLHRRQTAQAKRAEREAIAAQPASQPAQPSQLRPAIIPPPPAATPSPSFADQAPPGTLRPTYLAKGGHQVTFIQQAGQWWARVNEHLPIGFTRSIDLPVYCEPGLCVAQVDHHDPTWHKHRLHVCFPEKAPAQRGYVYVGTMGLKGGAGIQMDVEGIISTLIAGYSFIQPRVQLDPELVVAWRDFLHELASIIASTEVELDASTSNPDPGNLRTRIEGILERSTQRRMHLGNYGAAYHHILEQVRAQIRQRQSIPIQASAYPADSYAITLRLRLANLYALLLELNKVFSVEVGGTTSFDLGNLLDVAEVVVHFNDRFATFEQALQARQREEEQSRQAAQRQREEESLQEKLANLALDQGEEEEFHLAELEQPSNQPASSSAINQPPPIPVVFPTLSTPLPDKTTLQEAVPAYVQACANDPTFQALRQAVATTQTQLQAAPSNTALQAQLAAQQDQFWSHPLSQEGTRLAYAATQLRIAAEDQADHLRITHGDPHHGPGFSAQDLRETKQHRAEAQAIKQELLAPVREALGRPSSPRGSQQTSAFAAGVGKSAWGVVEVPVMLGKFGINTIKSLATWQDHLGLKDKAATAQELFAALCQDTQYDWEHPEEYRQRMAAAQAYQQQCLVHDQAFNAEQYHLNQAQQAGYVTAEALQFVLGPEIIKGALKAGSRVMGLGAKVAEARDVSSFLSNPAKASQFADEIISLNKVTDGKGVLQCGDPLSILHSASYHTSSIEQGAAIFKGIIQDHTFINGNKRTAVAAFKSFASKNGIKVKLSDGELMDLATQVALRAIDDIAQIGTALTK